ncbi:hypothetical protein JTB14_008671 [Gonioctena quinquepunctata]|nr:hypothetical protein JTB14_008671 [Gonioctena quinquepunctata]
MDKIECIKCKIKSNLRETKNPVFACDSCRNYYCGECSELSPSEIKCMPLQKRHLKFNCTRCRNNEINDCLRKTIEDKEQIIEDKNIIIKMLQDRINELENNSKTYANILTMNTENQPSSQTTIKNIPVVIIKPLNPQDGELTKAEIQKKINPNSINVSINSLKTARNGNVTIKCSSIEGAEKLLQETKTKTRHQIRHTIISNEKTKDKNNKKQWRRTK